MKYLIILLALIGCTESKGPVENVVGLKVELRETKLNLDACQNKLLTGHTELIDDPITIDDSSALTEPQYETVTYYEVDGTRCNSTNGEAVDSILDGSARSCGRSFWDCKDGFVRECMINVKYKIKEEQKLIE
jgi:hypothetical protein